MSKRKTKKKAKKLAKELNAILSRLEDMPRDICEVDTDFNFRLMEAGFVALENAAFTFRAFNES